MGDPLDKVTKSLMTAVLAVIIICSVLIPITLNQISSMETLYEDATTYTPLISTVIIIAIVAVIYGIIKGFSGREDR